MIHNNHNNNNHLKEHRSTGIPWVPLDGVSPPRDPDKVCALQIPPSSPVVVVVVVGTTIIITTTTVVVVVVIIECWKPRRRKENQHQRNSKGQLRRYWQPRGTDFTTKKYFKTIPMKTFGICTGTAGKGNNTGVVVVKVKVK